MDIRSKHLSSEERGVILAEHNRGSSQRLIAAHLARTSTAHGLLWRSGRIHPRKFGGVNLPMPCVGFLGAYLSI